MSLVKNFVAYLFFMPGTSLSTTPRNLSPSTNKANIMNV
jgi:hypothetical protein